MTEEALKLAAQICRHFEGLYLGPYLCPSGVPTIGWGSTMYEDGTPVTLTDPIITRDRAEQLLQHDLRTRRLPAVRRLCPHIDTPGRLAAVMDFAFNLGLGNLRSSTLRRVINRGDWDLAPQEFRKWKYSRGKVLRGLVRRREAEIVVSILGETKIHLY